MQTLEETVLKPIMWAVAALMVGFHKVLSFLGMPADSGWTWAMSIIGLTLVIRIILIPLFVKQIHASRNMQLIQPEMQKIQKKYKGKSDPDSRKAMSAETMELYKRTGTNPFSSCMPILLQSPIFFALFRVLNDLHGIANGDHKPIGPMSQVLASSAEKSDLFGATLSSTFVHANGNLSVQIVAIVLIACMSITTFTTQHQLMRKNMPASALDNPAAKMQKYMIWLMPVFFAVSGVNFPIGVLLYWFATNVWSMGQQFYVIRRMPAPGSPAERALEDRRIAQGKVHTRLTLPGLHKDGAEEAAAAAAAEAEAAAPVSRQRQQPKRKNRQKAVGGAAQLPTPGSTAEAAGPAAEVPDTSTSPSTVPATSSSPSTSTSTSASTSASTTPSESPSTSTSASTAPSTAPDTSTSASPSNNGEVVRKKRKKAKGVPSAGRST